MNIAKGKHLNEIDHIISEIIALVFKKRTTFLHHKFRHHLGLVLDFGVNVSAWVHRAWDFLM